MSREADEVRIVADLGDTMRYKLAANRHKRMWSEDTNAVLLARAREELDELQQALENGDMEEICNECADVANFMAMIHDNATHGRRR